MYNDQLETEIETAKKDLPEQNTAYNVMDYSNVPQSEELSEEDKKFLDDIHEKYKDRDDYADTPVITEMADVVVDENSGQFRIEDVGTGSDVKSMGEGSGDVVAEIIEKGSASIDELPEDDKIKEELKDVYDLEDEEILSMIMILQKLQQGENFSVYNALPEKMQALVKSAMASNSIPITMENRNIVAKALINDLLTDIKNNDECFVEFNEAIAEIAKIPSVMDFYAENCQETMEQRLVETAEKCREENPKVADTLIGVSNAWKDTYTFVRQHNLLDTSERARNRVTKDVENYKKFVENFRFAVQTSKTKFIINDVDLVTRAMQKFFGDEYNLDNIKAFTILLCKICDGIDFNDPVQFSFAYYSIKNIIALEFVAKDGTILTFNETLITNIRKLMDRIVEIDKENRARLANRPMTKKEKRHARRNGK